MSIKTKERVLKLARLYQQEIDAYAAKINAETALSERHKEWDEVRFKIDSLENELESGAE